jgi:hypothetical protein
MNSRLTLAAVAAAASLFFANDASAQAKSNIADDPNSSSCTENCIDAGYEWAMANEPTDEADCNAANSDFADGCKHWLIEQDELSAPPPEEPAEAPMDDSAAPMPDEAAPMPDEGAPMDDSAAPMPDEGAPADDSSEESQDSGSEN